MLVKTKEIIVYKDSRNRMPFIEWQNSLQKTDRLIVYKRLERLKLGNYGDYKSVGDGVLELRFNQGFRIYFTEVDNVIILLLCGGDKSTQQNDIEKVKEYNKILKEKGIENCIRN